MARGGKRPGAGRPSIEPAREHLHIRISIERLTAYREAAARAGLTLSEWVLMRLDEEAGR